MNDTTHGAPIYPNVLSAGTFSASNIKVFDPSFRVPRILQGDFIVQRELPWNTVFSISYLLSQGRHLPNFIDENIAPATTTKTYTFSGGPLNGETYTLPFYTARLNPAYGQITHIVSNVNQITTRWFCRWITNSVAVCNFKPAIPGRKRSMTA